MQKTYKTRLSSIIRIQSVLRMIVHRLRAIRLAQVMYMKYIDPKEKREYWFNPHSKQSLWVKPKLLGHLDCGAPIQLPNSREEFVVLCSVCLTRTSNTYCDDCDDSMCTQCYTENHKAGHRKLHKRLDTNVCVQCEYQVGTRYCVTCEDHYCDTCFKYMHRKGRLKLHIYKWTCSSCENCEDRAVQWDRCSADDNYQIMGYCTVCCWKLFDNPRVS